MVEQANKTTIENLDKWLEQEGVPRETNSEMGKAILLIHAGEILAKKHTAVCLEHVTYWWMSKVSSAMVYQLLPDAVARWKEKIRQHIKENE